AVRSTGIEGSLFQCGRTAPHQRGQLALERAHLFPQLSVLGRQRLLAGREMMIELPPVEADLLGFVDRADEQPDADGQELDLRQRNLDVAGDHEALIEYTVENVDQACGSSVPLRQWRRHKLRILWRVNARCGACGTGRANLSNGGATQKNRGFGVERTGDASKPDNDFERIVVILYSPRSSFGASTTISTSV